MSNSVLKAPISEFLPSETGPDKHHSLHGSSVEVASDTVAEWTAEAERRMIHKVDLRLLLPIWVIGLACQMDRNNIGNARIAGMAKDLDFSSTDFSNSISLFYIGYLGWSIVSNMIIARTRPSLFLSGMAILWGTVTCCMAAVTTYPQLLVLRILLGFLEAGLVPGVLFVLSCWYKPGEFAKRLSAFVTASMVGGALGGLVAGGVTRGLEGAHGIRGWRWLFLVEGVFTIGFAIISTSILPDYPQTCRWLSEDERAIAVGRLERFGVSTVKGMPAEDRPRLGKIRSLVVFASDWRIYVLFLGVSSLGSSLVLSYFYPTLVNGLGYTSPVQAQYMTAPIYLTGLAVSVLLGFVCDRWPARVGLFMGGCMTFGAIMSIAICLNYGYLTRYVLIVFQNAGAAPTIVGGNAFNALLYRNAPPEVRALVFGTLAIAANLGNLFGAYLFPTESGPKYLLGFGVNAGTMGFGAFVYLLLHFLLIRRKKGPIEEREISGS
ncbi:pantothenate transporter liz1 [Podospora didyma]|uniref:Pantothenate transporter liz1 n=1 Tax=Podospora didyma TaxID=330526 RepID=A0AAE0NZV4_9PEZI|nr:pantothenate transporter liz1 [Podospora didyma]